MIGNWTDHGWDPPESFEPSPNPEEAAQGYFHRVGPGEDDNDPANWWQRPQIPEGFAPSPKPEEAGWYYRVGDVDLNDMANWVHDETVSDEPAQPEQSAGNWYDPIFARARETYGLSPYEFGGDRQPGLSQGPWDCVGWVMECFDAAGIDIDPEHDEPYTNAERARQATTPISEDQVQPGDLVFFAGTYDTPGASHIGIVIDPANHVMADDHDRGNGTGPGETNYNEPYWRQHLMGFTRVNRPFDSGGSTAPRIINTDGEDIGGMLKSAADAAGIPLELALACAIAESDLNPRAERRGAWPDISFGYGQQIVLYHYLGDHTSSPENIAAVREGVFADPQWNLDDMCKRLASDLQRVQNVDLGPVAGDQLLGALVVYNSGSWHSANDAWWGAWSGNVRNYQRALTQAREMLGG